MLNENQNSAILCAIRASNQAAALVDLRTACHRLLLDSDLVQCTDPRFTEEDVDVMVSGMVSYILNPLETELQEVEFKNNHPLMGKTIDFVEFASRVSADFLSQALGYWNELWNSHPVLSDAFEKLDELFVAICFRYAYCITTNVEAFPVSLIVIYMRACNTCMSLGQREHIVSRTLNTTLDALTSYDPSWYK